MVGGLLKRCGVGEQLGCTDADELEVEGMRRLPLAAPTCSSRASAAASLAGVAGGVEGFPWMNQRR